MSSYVEQLQLSCLKSKVAIVTRASQGLGTVIVQGLAQSGATVCGTGKPAAAQWQTTEEEFYLRCNVQDQIAFQFLCEELYDQYKQINVLVNVAEISTPFKTIDPKAGNAASFQEAIEKEIDTAIGNSKTIAKYMNKSEGGSIINVINLKNTLGFPDDFGYIATKNALLTMTKKLAVDLIKDNIRVNNIVLGYQQNGMINPQGFDSAVEHQWKDLIGSTIFLASNNSSSGTGQDIFILGDRSAQSQDNQQVLSSLS